MPLLQVRDFPPDLYDAISRVARAENRTIPQQTIVLLKNCLEYYPGTKSTVWPRCGKSTN